MKFFPFIELALALFLGVAFSESLIDIFDLLKVNISTLSLRDFSCIPKLLFTLTIFVLLQIRMANEGLRNRSKKSDQ